MLDEIRHAFLPKSVLLKDLSSGINVHHNLHGCVRPGMRWLFDSTGENYIR
jgi:hypothetical protein